MQPYPLQAAYIFIVCDYSKKNRTEPYDARSTTRAERRSVMERIPDPNRYQNIKQHSGTDLGSKKHRIHKQIRIQFHFVGRITTRVSRSLSRTFQCPRSGRHVADALLGRGTDVRIGLGRAVQLQQRWRSARARMLLRRLYRHRRNGHSRWLNKSRTESGEERNPSEHYRSHQEGGGKDQLVDWRMAGASV